jgi:AcrR family transcriptional regulator
MANDTGSDVPQRVLQAAKQVFFERGFHKSSLRAIAKRAGTSESGVLRFYQGKLHLLQAVYASCWAEINARLDKAMTAAAAGDLDPRSLLVQLMRTVLESYQADQPMMIFMLSNFGFQTAAGYSTDEDVDSAADSQARQEYHRYLTRIHDLCDAVTSSQPTFAQAGITGTALGHMFIAMTNGVQGGWYAALLEPGLERPQLTIEEALRGMRLFLYQESSRRSRI